MRGWRSDADPTAQELNQKLIFRRHGARNAVSGVAATLTTVVTLWAKVTDLGGDVEQTEQSDHAFRQRYEIWTRYSDSVTAFSRSSGHEDIDDHRPPQKVIDVINRW